MKVEDTKHYRDVSNGMLVDEVQLSGSAFSDVSLRELDDEGRVVLQATREGTQLSFVFRLLDESYQGLLPVEVDRREIPDDLQDVCYQLGFAPRPTTITIE